MSPVFSANPVDPIRKLISKVGFEEAAKILDESVEALEEYISRAVLRQDFAFFAENKLYVEDDTIVGDNRVVRFKLNGAQIKLDAAIEEQILQNKPVRLIHLKPRQYGSSTFWTGRIFRDVLFRKNLHISTISYQYDSAEWIRGIAGRFYDYFRGPKLELKARNEKTWKFPDMDSTWRIDSAENLQAGHSFTHQILHVSELSQWERDADTLLRGLTSSIQAIPGTMIVIESTANGYGDVFHELWQRAKKGIGYKPIFVAWFEIEKHRMPFRDNRIYDDITTVAEFERSLDGEERVLRDNYNLCLEQLHWRRWKIQRELKGDEDGFHEQFPSNDDEAFLASGRPYFLLGKIRQELLRTEKLEPKRGYLDWEVYGEKVRFVEDRNGWWTIFKEPEEGYEYRYVTGSDVAEGKIVIEGKKEPDNSSTRVRDRITQEEVAAFCGILDTDLFAIEIHKANVWYKSACDCVERNSAGIAVINALKEKEGVNLFKRTLLGKEDDKETVEYGFQTNTATRDYLLSELRTWIREESYNSDDRDFWDECLTFVHNDKGKPEAQKGKKDDRVLAAGLTIQAELQANEVRSIERPKERIYTAPDYDEDWEKEESPSVYVQF